MAGMIERGAQMAARIFRLKVLRRARSYQAVLALEGDRARDREIVLADLRDFCRAGTTTFRLDPCDAARLQGRREVWLRISQHLNLDEAKVQKLVEIDDGLGD
jgi:hypothetical protein